MHSAVPQVKQIKGYEWSFKQGAVTTEALLCAYAQNILHVPAIQHKSKILTA